MKKLALALALLLVPSLAWAQCTGVFPPNTLCGNLSGSPAPPSAFTASTIAGPGSSTVGDIAVWNNTGGSLLKDVPPLQIYGTIGNNLFLAGPSTGGPLNPTFRAITSADFGSVSNPTHQVFLSGSGTYTTPVGARWIEIHLIGGGGGGGGGSGTSTFGGNGGAGGNTCWNTTGAACTSSVYQAGGGAAGLGGMTGTSLLGGAGGTVTGSGTCDWSVAGGVGLGSSATSGFTFNTSGMPGGASSLGGNGSSGGFTVGVAPAANSGSGGVGGSGDSTNADYGGTGGGAGATCHVIISGPGATYTYAIGAAGTAGAAGTGGTNPRAGTVGAAGQIIVYEHYAP